MSKGHAFLKESMFSNHHFKGPFQKPTGHVSQFNSNPQKKGQVSCFSMDKKWSIPWQPGTYVTQWVSVTPTGWGETTASSKFTGLAVSIFSEVFWISRGITKTMQGMNAFWGTCIGLKWSESRKSRNTHMSSTSTLQYMWWWKSYPKWPLTSTPNRVTTT